MSLVNNNEELKELLNCLDESIHKETNSLLSNSSLKPLFSSMIKIITLDNGCFDQDVVDRLDVLTDNLDSLNFGLVMEDISELRDLL